MAGTKLAPEKITNPIQLMAAWFAMLILLVTIFLTAAANIQIPDWAPGFLVIFSSLTTIIVIGCVGLMLTVFRSNLQDVKEYAQWLKNKNSYSPSLIDQTIMAKNLVKRESNSPTTSSKSMDKNFLIEVSGNVLDAKNLVRKIRESGFQSNIYSDPLDNTRDQTEIEGNECIWVGARIQAAGAIEAIKLAVNHWPQLKYLELSTDGSDPPDEVHDSLFLGGATSTALERGLKPWTKDEIMALSSSFTQEQFHVEIRKKYS